MRKPRKKFSYRGNDDSQTKRKAAGSGDYDPILNVPYTYIPKEGSNRARVLPRTWSDDEGPKHWAFKVFIHYDVGPDNGRYVCPRKMRWGECPMCEERDQVIAEGGPDADDLSWQLRPGPSELCYTLDRKEIEKGPLPWFMPAKKVAKNVCSIAIDETTGAVLKIDHPDEGRDIIFQVSGKGKRKDYSGIKIAHSASSISEDDDEYNDWMDHIEDHPIPSLLIKYSYEFLKEVFGGVSVKKEKPAEEPRRRRRPTSTDVIDDETEELDAATGEIKKKVKKKKVKKTTGKRRRARQEESATTESSDGSRGSARRRIREGTSRARAES